MKQLADQSWTWGRRTISTMLYMLGMSIREKNQKQQKKKKKKSKK
jgi:hypothetical protein